MQLPGREPHLLPLYQNVHVDAGGVQKKMRLPCWAHHLLRRYRHVLEVYIDVDKEGEDEAPGSLIFFPYIDIYSTYTFISIKREKMRIEMYIGFR